MSRPRVLISLGLPLLLINLSPYPLFLFKGSRYYFGADGYAYVGSHKIAKKLYVFDENGCLLSKKKNKLVNVCGKTYYITLRMHMQAEKNQTER